MLIDRIKAQMLAALKGRRPLEKEILGVALGELQTIEARNGGLTDEEAEAIVRKLVKSNRETLEASPPEAQRVALEEEIAILQALLPKSRGADELLAALEPVKEALRAAPNDGAATGIAMKTLKALGGPIDGKLVGEVVKRLRA